MEESIYNLVPKQQAPTVKQALYQSKFKGNLLPTGSTFCHKGTAGPLVTNLSGDMQLKYKLSHSSSGRTSTMGLAKQHNASNPTQFLKRKTKINVSGSESLRKIEFTYHEKRKPLVPKSNQTYLMKSKSSKDFILANSLNALLSTPKKPQQQINWTKKSQFGKIPKYLKQLNNQIKTQKNNQFQRQIQHNQQCSEKFIEQQQLNELKNGLKLKWHQINQQYQKQTHKNVFSTVSGKLNKQNYEKQLKQIQQGLAKCNKNYVVIRG